ncbi:hypothetical protein [Amycolatopsis sp. CA-126428]|uniref:hypothetical protein n=1 Tax=Amycolatopsis sp. CA-126428 TaxID=2073158 RepID=UPI000CD14001|nr:hypothetical protein [Amycolatopsis sp. CA-126428]
MTPEEIGSTLDTYVNKVCLEGDDRLTEFEILFDEMTAMVGVATTGMGSQEVTAFYNVVGQMHETLKGLLGLLNALGSAKDAVKGAL